MKKFLSATLALILVIAAVLPGMNVTAATASSSAIKSHMKSTYEKALSNTGEDSFDGWCGECVAQQLLVLGVNTSRVVTNGNATYEKYAGMQKTSGGYTVNKYPAASYSMKTALNLLNNSSDAYTYALINFEKSPGSDGQLYGHTLLVYAVVDGTVYYAESFVISSMNSVYGVRSIDSFCSAYGQTGYIYEGMIWFTKNDSSSSYSTGTYTPTDSIGSNIREGASTSHSVVGAIPYGTNFIVTEISGNWGKTTYNGVTGWVCLDYANLINTNVSSQYDAAAAIEYGKNHWNDGVGLCAEFVSNCLKAGGSTSWSRGCTPLVAMLKNENIGTLHELTVNSDGTISLEKNKDILSPGDPIFVYSEGCIPVDNAPYVHVYLYYDVDSSGNLKGYAHNNASNGTIDVYFTCAYCEKPTDGAYVFHMNSNDDEETESDEWSEWSEWSTTKPTESDTVQIESKTQYGYYHYILEYSDGNCGAYPITASEWNKIFTSNAYKTKVDSLTYGSTTYNCYPNSCCPDSYNYDNGSNASYFYYLDTRTVYRSRTKISPEPFELSGVTMTLGSSLSLDFAVDTSKLTGSDNYAEFTIAYADGRESETVTVPQSEWTQFSGTIYTAKFTGMAAKQMNDVVTAVFYNADGQPLTIEKSDSIETYAVRMLNGSAASNKKLRTVYVDMLNYGAVAQTQFAYDETNLANRNLTSTHKAWATASVATTDNRVKGTGYVGSTLTLSGEIQLDLVFGNSAVGSDYSSLYAIVTYTDHYGNAKEIRIEGTDFIKYSSSYCQVSITGMAVADFRSVVTCTVYNANGVAVANAADSIESYANRMASSIGATVDAIVKFGASSYNYFH